MIWAALGPTFMTAQLAGLKKQKCQRNLPAIYIERTQNTLGCKMFAQGEKQLETRVIFKISTQPC